MKSQDHIPGFDYARALFSIFVVLWHTHSIMQPTLWSATDITHYRPSVNDILNFHGLLEAVPFFVTMSVYLYVRRGGGISRLSKRCAHLFLLALFWGIASQIFSHGVQYLQDLANLFKSHPFVMTAQAGGTIFYFFASLLVTIVWTEIVQRLKTNLVWAALVLSSGLFTLLAWLLLSGHSDWTLSFWSPLNYVMYPPAIVLFIRYQELLMRRPFIVSSIFLALCVLASIAEWHTLILPAVDAPGPGAYGFPEYTRLSALLMSMVLLPVFLRIKKPAPALIVYASNTSLSLYCLQVFMFLLIPLITSNSPIPPLLLAVSTISGSYACAAILRRFILSPKLLG